MHKFHILIVFLGVILVASCDYTGSKPKINKDIRDFNDADMERLLDQWNVSILDTSSYGTGH